MSLFKNLLDGVHPHTKKYVNRQVGFAATVAEKLQFSRLTQRELAERLGKKESYISRILSGDANPTLKTISELEVALGADVINFNLENRKGKSSSVITFGSLYRLNLDVEDNLRAVS